MRRRATPIHWLEWGSSVQQGAAVDGLARRCEGQSWDCLHYLWPFRSRLSLVAICRELWLRQRVGQSGEGGCQREGRSWGGPGFGLSGCQMAKLGLRCLFGRLTGEVRTGRCYFRRCGASWRSFRLLGDNRRVKEGRCFDVHTEQKRWTHLVDRHMGNSELSGESRARSGVCPEVYTLAGDVSICTDWGSWKIPWSSDRLSPPCAASPPWGGNLLWCVIPVGSGDRQGQVFDAVSGGKVGQVELGDFAAASMSGSAGFNNCLLLRKVIGCWGRTGGDISALDKSTQSNRLLLGLWRILYFITLLDLFFLGLGKESVSIMPCCRRTACNQTSD